MRNRPMRIRRSHRARIITLIALVHFGNDWHGGMATRAYQDMCRAAALLRHHGVIADGIAVLNRRMSPEVKAVYDRLVAVHGERNDGLKPTVPGYTKFFDALPARY